jgi:hypothetical protein
MWICRGDTAYGFSTVQEAVLWFDIGGIYGVGVVGYGGGRCSVAEL